MKTICSLQPSSSSPLRAHVLLFCFDLAAFTRHRALHRILSHRLGLDRWYCKFVQGHTVSEEASGPWS